MHRCDQLVRHAGNGSLFDAVEMSVLAAHAGVALHLHVEGVRGTGKTTVLRAARAILPPIRRVTGCLYNCDPAAPHCPRHRHLSRAELASLGVEQVPMPFLEISHAAKVGTVVGSIDLRRLTDPSRPEAALLPGTLAQAHRGVVLVDEVNRLAETAPELADVLLDAMGTRPGRVQIEEAGLPVVRLPLQVTVWAASNPDEDPGPLDETRRQLADRFDLVVSVGPPGDENLVAAVLLNSDRRLGRASCFPAEGQPAPDGWPGPAAGGLDAERLRRTQVPEQLRRLIASLYLRFSVESLRAAEAMQLAARAAAALDGREEVTRADLARVAPLVLRHRLEPEALARAMAFLAGGEGGERIAGVHAAAPASVPPEAGRSTPQPPAQPSVARAAPGAAGWWGRILSRWRGRPSHPPPEGVRSAARKAGVAPAQTPSFPAPPLPPPEPARPLADLPVDRWVTPSEGSPR